MRAHARALRHAPCTQRTCPRLQRSDHSPLTPTRGSQALLTRLLVDVLGEIVGEEDESTLDITTAPFRAGEITAPAELEAMIIGLRERVDVLKATLPPLDAYRGLCAFIDPIDGTKEFCTGKGEQCSICIGFAERESGMAHAGLVYRPLCPERTYALGCAAEGTAESKLQQHAPLEGGAFLVSNGGASPFLSALTAELGYTARGQGASRLASSPPTSPRPLARCAPGVRSPSDRLPIANLPMRRRRGQQGVTRPRGGQRLLHPGPWREPVGYMRGAGGARGARWLLLQAPSAMRHPGRAADPARALPLRQGRGQL